MAASSGSTVDVLIGSPRDSFMDAVKVILKGYYPYQLRQFKTVDEALESQNFHPILALIDGQDGSNSTNEWVQSVKMNFSDCHVIVLHSAAAPLNFDAIKKNGADEMMHINFDREFISDMVLQLAPVEMEGDNIPITALMPVDLRDIEAQMNINFDVYVHLPANHRSVLMRKAGDILDEKQIAKFLGLKQQMYIKKTQRKEFFEYARTVQSLRNSPFPVSMTEKFHRSKKAIYEIMAQFLNGAATDFSGGRLIFDKCKEIIADFELTKDLDKETLFTEIFRFTGNTRTLYHDCICLSAYAAFFAQAMGWGPEKRESAALAGLLHNVGLSQMPVAMAEKDPQYYTPEELKEFHLYPDRSVNMVKAKKVPLSVEISEAIGQHREKVNGKGFPKALPGEDLSDLGKLMIFAYRFMELTSLREHRQAMPPAQALQLLRDNSIEATDDGLDMLTATTIFKKYK
ncbi:hypothetical protein AZI86_14855 [Bdellovibrio bacteriovorus]|uniref:HD-GYP domain-containing protein n=2 Tax=Bdellovibrio bacteriovorus TaxID=959 RepID=A0A150WK58_BDEBC|nr:hypothetical protein AZI86_14855 [Bdellovibrio bacteriovorus]